MKKLIATLFMMTLGLSLVAVADPTYTLKNGTYENAFAVLEPTQFNPSTNTTTYTKSNLLLDYTVTGSVNRTLADLQKVKDENGNYVKDAKGNFVYEKDANGNYVTKNKGTKYDLAHVYFTSNNNFRMAMFVDIDPNQTKDELFINTKLNITDYGIYLFEDNDPTNGFNEDYAISLKNGDVAISEGQNFGVYYKAETTYGTRVHTNTKYGKTYEDRVEYNEKFDMSDEKGLTGTTTGTYTTAEHWVASYDGVGDGNHNLNPDAAWYSDTNLYSREAIFCMFQGPFYDKQPAYLEWEHVEFGFVTTGQPLPGTLTTLLISGLCAAGLRKRNKK